MENCYKMYSWLCRTLVALLLEMFWKMRQITDFFSHEQSEEDCTLAPLPSELSPLSKQTKYRRHIRSMSDVQRSTPFHGIPVSPFRRISQPILYQSEMKMKRRRIRQRHYEDSSDSCSEKEWKSKSLERNLKICKAADSMRYL